MSKKPQRKDTNSLILMLGILNCKLDEIITILSRMDKKDAKRVEKIAHIAKCDIDTPQ